MQNRLRLNQEQENELYTRLPYSRFHVFHVWPSIRLIDCLFRVNDKKISSGYCSPRFSLLWPINRLISFRLPSFCLHPTQLHTRSLLLTETNSFRKRTSCLWRPLSPSWRRSVGGISSWVSACSILHSSGWTWKTRSTIRRPFNAASGRMEKAKKEDQKHVRVIKRD